MISTFRILVLGTFLMLVSNAQADPLDERPHAGVVCKRIIAYGETPRQARRAYDRQKRIFEAAVLAKYKRLQHVRTDGGSYFDVPCRGGTELGRAKKLRCKLDLRPCYLRLRPLPFFPSPLKRRTP